MPPFHLIRHICHDPLISSSIALIHELQMDNAETWDDNSWRQYLQEEVPESEMHFYRYHPERITKPSDMFNTEVLSRNADTFLTDMEKLGELPVIVVAHGFGGLIYEEVSRIISSTC